MKDHTMSNSERIAYLRAKIANPQTSPAARAFYHRALILLQSMQSERDRYSIYLDA
jgi:hypothetical protein